MKPNWKLTEALGAKLYQGQGGGVLIFWPDRVETRWNHVAPIASAQGAGNRKAKLTVPTGKRTPPELQIHYHIALAVRGYIDEYGTPPPEEPTDAELEKLMKRPFGRYAWAMLHAMMSGDFEELQRYTDATELARENPDRAGIYDEVETALRLAALKAGEPPTQKAVFGVWKKWRSANQLGQRTDLRDELGRMGFGWLPAGGRGEASNGRKTQGRG